MPRRGHLPRRSRRRARSRARSRRRRPRRQTRLPPSRPAWAVTFAPRAWAASTTRAISSAVHGDRVPVGAVEVELEEVGAVVELADRARRRSSSPSVASTVSPAGQRAGLRRATSPRRACGGSRPWPRQRSRTPEAERALAAVDRVDAVRRADVARPADAGVRQQPRVVLRDVAASARGGSRPRSIQCEPPGHRQVAVAVDHARDDRRAAGVDDLERRPRAGSSSASVGRIQAMRPSSTRMLTPSSEARGAAVGERGVAVEGAHRGLAYGVAGTGRSASRSSRGGAGGPLARRRAIFESRSNQNGAPSESAKALTSRPKSFAKYPFQPSGQEPEVQPTGRFSCCTSSTHAAARSCGESSGSCPGQA